MRYLAITTWMLVSLLAGLTPPASSAPAPSWTITVDGRATGNGTVRVKNADFDVSVSITAGRCGLSKEGAAAAIAAKLNADPTFKRNYTAVRLRPNNHVVEIRRLRGGTFDMDPITEDVPGQSYALAPGLELSDPVDVEISNLGSRSGPIFAGHVLTSPESGPGIRVLYAPSEADDAGYRATLAARLGGGAVVDYYAAHFGTPDAALLGTYDCVMTWTNYAYSDAALFGNNLADFVDGGGTVVLGAFVVYTIGNALAGCIVEEPAYCPVRGGFNHFSFSMWSGDGASDCLHQGVSSYGATYRDYLVLDGTGAVAPGHFNDGEISVAYNAPRSVIYANGAGGFPIDGGAPDFDLVVANACVCSGPTVTEAATWGGVKKLYR